jgi:hypothetical protein
MTTAKKKKTRAKLDEIILQLDGHIYLIEKSGRRTKKTEIDGELVLKMLIGAIERGVALAEQEVERRRSLHDES